MKATETNKNILQENVNDDMYNKIIKAMDIWYAEIDGVQMINTMTKNEILLACVNYLLDNFSNEFDANKYIYVIDNELCTYYFDFE